MVGLGTQLGERIRNDQYAPKDYGDDPAKEIYDPEGLWDNLQAFNCAKKRAQDRTKRMKGK